MKFICATLPKTLLLAFGLCAVLAGWYNGTYRAIVVEALRRTSCFTAG